MLIKSNNFFPAIFSKILNSDSKSSNLPMTKNVYSLASYMDGHKKPQSKKMHNDKGEERHFPLLVWILVEVLPHRVSYNIPTRNLTKCHLILNYAIDD